MKAATQAKRNLATSFGLAAPEATEVFLAGDFNQWSTTATPMKRRSDGAWVVGLELPARSVPIQVRRGRPVGLRTWL